MNCHVALVCCECVFLCLQRAEAGHGSSRGVGGDHQPNRCQHRALVQSGEYVDFVISMSPLWEVESGWGGGIWEEGW